MCQATKTIVFMEKQLINIVFGLPRQRLQRQNVSSGENTPQQLTMAPELFTGKGDSELGKPHSWGPC